MWEGQQCRSAARHARMPHAKVAQTAGCHAPGVLLTWSDGAVGAHVAGAGDAGSGQASRAGRPRSAKGRGAHSKGALHEQTEQRSGTLLQRGWPPCLNSCLTGPLDSQVYNGSTANLPGRRWQSRCLRSQSRWRRWWRGQTRWWGGAPPGGGPRRRLCRGGLGGGSGWPGRCSSGCRWWEEG